MSSPFVSIIIPTRQRPQTLRYSIQTVLDQTYTDLELIIMDNNSSDETQSVVDSFMDPRIRYCYSHKYLPMSENWEKGLSYAEGQYILFLGDDDAMLPDALAVAHRFVANSDAQILSWNRDDCLYRWKDSIIEPYRNLLSISIQPPQLLQINSIDLLQKAYRSQVDYRVLPMIYSAFIHRNLILEIMMLNGKYFCHPVPDVFSGIVNAYFTESYCFSTRPLSMAGLSGRSTGQSFDFPHLSERARDSFLEELANRGDEEVNHPKLAPGANQGQIKIADTFLKTKDLFFPEDDRIQFDMLQFILSLPDHLGMDPNTFDEEVELVVELARRNNISESDITLPSPRFAPPHRFVGFSFSQDQAVRLTVDCDSLSVENIYQASKIAYAILNRL